VADHFGVHRFDGQGAYLDSPIALSEGDFSPRSFFSLGVHGYGRSTIIAVGDPRSSGIECLSAK
jgi:hypothetical protein